LINQEIGFNFTENCVLYIFSAMNVSYCITIRSRYDHTNRQSQRSLGKTVNNRGKLLKHEGTPRGLWWKIFSIEVPMLFVFFILKLRYMSLYVYFSSNVAYNHHYAYPWRTTYVSNARVLLQKTTKCKFAE
jgi:hypothetical protein